MEYLKDIIPFLAVKSRVAGVHEGYVIHLLNERCQGNDMIRAVNLLT